MRKLLRALAAKTPWLGGVLRERDWLRQRRAYLEPYKTWVPPGHFYSPVPSVEDLRRRASAVFTAPPGSLPAIELGLDAQLRLLSELIPFAGDFTFPSSATPPWRYHCDNPYFRGLDAFLLYALWRRRQPRRIIEIGSGFSSALMLDTAQRHCPGPVEFTFIEPNPQRLQTLLTSDDTSRGRLIAQPLQEVDHVIFSSLQAGDFLFIDSSHVAKTGGEVNLLMFEILPALPAGVLVHFHDILYPFEYPADWVYEGRAWNEAYLLRAFLQYNSAFAITLFASALLRLHPQIIARDLPALPTNHQHGAQTGILWIQKISPPA